MNIKAAYCDVCHKNRMVHLEVDPISDSMSASALNGDRHWFNRYVLVCPEGHCVLPIGCDVPGLTNKTFDPLLNLRLGKRS